MAGGRWSEEAVDFVRQLSIAKAQDVPSFMRRSVSLSWERRWTRTLSVVCATAFAASLVEPGRQCESICWSGGDAPPLADVVAGSTRVQPFLVPRSWSVSSLSFPVHTTVFAFARLETHFKCVHAMLLSDFGIHFHHRFIQTTLSSNFDRFHPIYHFAKKKNKFIQKQVHPTSDLGQC